MMLQVEMEKRTKRLEEKKNPRKRRHACKACAAPALSLEGQVCLTTVGRLSTGKAFIRCEQHALMCVFMVPKNVQSFSRAAESETFKEEHLVLNIIRTLSRQKM